MVDYQQLGFKAGLEIHQQLDGLKLYCNCKTLNTTEDSNYSAHRKLRAVVGETGEIDPAAAHESQKAKTFHYSSHLIDTCEIEYDEEPPKSMNQHALQTTLEVALLLNATIVDEIHIMRKTVVDGSNVSGFQRTALVAMNGFIDTQKGKVKIDSICLEEEAAQKLESTKQETHYKLDRLGIPLIEIATDASIVDPEHAKEVAAHIGMVLRSVSGVKRGLGTIRQDVNVSIIGGNRIEIKGFQDLKSIPKVIENEISRQQKLIDQKKAVTKEVRKAEPDFSTTFLRPMPGAARLYPETDCMPVVLDPSQVDHVKQNLPQLLNDKIKSYEKKYGLPLDLAKQAVSTEFFEDMVNTYSKLKPIMIAQTLFSTPKDLKTRLKLDVSTLTLSDYQEVLGYVNDGKIQKNLISELLTKKIKGESISLSEFAGVSDEEIEKEITRLIKEKPGLNIGGYMGLIMASFKGKADGKQVMSLLKKHLDQ